MPWGSQRKCDSVTKLPCPTRLQANLMGPWSHCAPGALGATSLLVDPTQSHPFPRTSLQNLWMPHTLCLQPKKEADLTEEADRILSLPTPYAG